MFSWDRTYDNPFLGLQENTRSPLSILVGGNGKIAYEMAERFSASGVECPLQFENEREHMTISDVLRAIKKHWIVEIVLFCVVVGVGSAHHADCIAFQCFGGN